MAKKKLAQAADYARATFAAELSREQVATMEEAANHPDHGCARRIGLLVLTRSKEELLERVDKEAVTAILHGYDAVHAYIEHLDAVRQLMQTATVRLMVVLESALAAHPELANLEIEELQP